MMSDYQRFEQPGDELDDDEGPDEYDYDDEVSETCPCPECGAEVYEDAERCPHCGAYITFATGPWSGRPSWWIVLGIVGVACAVLVLALGRF